MDRQCPYCGKTGFELLFAAPDFDTGKKTFHICRCGQCGLARTEPQLSDDELGRYYALPYYGTGEAKFTGPAEKITRFFNHRRAKTITCRLHDGTKPASGISGRVLDIGCGRGSLLATLRDMGYECDGVERHEFPSGGLPRGIKFHTGKLEDIAFDKDFFDAIIIWHVLEHVDDPVAMIKEASRILRPGGLLAIAVPNFGSIQSGFFKQNWFHLDLPRHIYHFTPGTLTGILEKFGFIISHTTTFSAEQNIFGFVQSALNMIARRRTPNRFYSLIKKTVERPSPAVLMSWAALACLILPFAVIEYLVSGMAGKGASLIMFSKRNM
ncbi:MAG: class I SAM-dependent methyltransferase [Syntrophorhabdus sp.]